MDNFGIFCDRDGVIVENRNDYIKSFSEAVIYPEAIRGLRLLTKLGYPIFIVSNQSCVGRGIISLELMDDIHKDILRRLSDEGIEITSSLICPHAPEDRCECRKPKTGMFEELCRHYKVRGGWMIGDGVEDMRAAQKAKLHPMLVNTGRGENTWLMNPHLNVARYANILKAAEAIANWQNNVLALTLFAPTVS